MIKRNENFIIHGVWRKGKHKRVASEVRIAGKRRALGVAARPPLTLLARLLSDWRPSAYSHGQQDSCFLENA